MCMIKSLTGSPLNFVLIKFCCSTRPCVGLYLFKIDNLYWLIIWASDKIGWKIICLWCYCNKICMHSRPAKFILFMTVPMSEKITIRRIVTLASPSGRIVLKFCMYYVIWMSIPLQRAQSAAKACIFQAPWI